MYFEEDNDLAAVSCTLGVFVWCWGSTGPLGSQYERHSVSVRYHLNCCLLDLML